ncbi:MAG: methyltransferase family protein [Sphingomonadaceae bacterium]
METGRTFSTNPPAQRPESDVSGWVGLTGLAGLAVWLLFCRSYPAIADALALPGPHEVLSGPNAALMGIVFAALPMILWSVLVDKVHRRPSTGIDWTRPRKWGADAEVSLTKLGGLWATWAIIAVLYVMCRWYWDGQFLFSMKVIGYAAIPMVVLSVPYVFWLDRVLVNPRDSAWHFGAMVFNTGEYDPEQVKKHWRAWIIKAFFIAFMISIVPGGFQNTVEADFSAVANNPVQLGWVLINLLFLIDVQIGTVGYLVTFRPLDAQIRSGNPFLAGWLAALMCYPPFVWVIIGNGDVLSYEHNVADWGIWLQLQPGLAWIWAALLVFLTGVSAWATFIFGLRFSNLTYRGVLTNGPYRFTRHPAYLSKNLFWWCSVMPFFVTNGSLSDALRNCFFLLCVNGIYYWRAKTEEAHLMMEDEKYRQYHAWMAAHGPITRRLEALKRKLNEKNNTVAQPAE